LLQLHDEQVGLNAALQAELLKLKAQQKEPAEEAPASKWEKELAEVTAALLAAEERQRVLEKASTVLRDELRQAKAAGKRRLSPPLTSPPLNFKSPVRPPEGWHHERLSATGDLSHLHSMSQHHSANQPRTGSGVFSPSISNASPSSPAETYGPLPSDQPAIMSTRRMWAAKEFLEFVDGRTALTPETLSGMEPQKPGQFTHSDHVKRWHPQHPEWVHAPS
jgi:hypothetical protein